MTSKFVLLAPFAGLAILAISAMPTSAQIVQTTAVPFLQIEPDSRAAGMGMTGVGIADNASALFWNPAGLAGQTGAEVSFTHAPWLPALGADLSYEYLAGKYFVEGIGTFAGHLTYLNLGEQERTDAQGNVLGTFKSYDLAVGGSYGTNITETLSVGTGLRLIYSNLAGGVEVEGQETRAGVAVGVDLGVLWSPQVGDGKFEPHLGLNLANMGPTIQYSDSEQADAIPTNLRFGGAVDANLDEYNTVTWAVDFNKLLVDRKDDGSYAPFYEAIFSSWGSVDVDLNPNDGEANPESVSALRQLTLGTGLEYWYSDLFALRTGYFYEDPANGNRKFLTFGAGLRYSLVGVDLSYIYALEENSPLAEQIRFSVMLNIDR
ncbi:MAG: type IX secretion system outer membrane channel protein PorV [Rubricoccaceae bacterium]|nr:type IX secretion system outer membrane channel protein PorV [Rubricoccaceae bacterium]